MLVVGTTLLPRLASAAAKKQQPIHCTPGNCKPVTLQTLFVYGNAPLPLSGWIDSFGSGSSYGNVSGAGRDYSHNDKTATTNKKTNKLHCRGYASDPVEVDDGAKLVSLPLFQMPGEMGLGYTLYYRSVTGSPIDASEPWTSNINYRLDLYCGFSGPHEPCNTVTLYRPDGSSIGFSGDPAGYGNFAEIGGGGLATLVHNTNGTWTLHDEDATVQTYDQYGNLTSIKDASGVGWTISSTTVSTDAEGTMTTTPPCMQMVGPDHDPCPNPPPKSPPKTTTTTVVTHTDGQSFTEVTVVTNAGTEYMSASVTVTDPAGNQYRYSMQPVDGGAQGWDVSSLTFPGSPGTTMAFSYTGSNSLLSGVAYNGTAYWSTSYNSSNEVSSDGAADGTQRTSIVYATTSNGMVATITNPLGLTTQNTYKTNAQGNYDLVSVSNSAVQGCGATTNSLAWDANDNLTKTVDNDGVTHTYSYAANGQLLTETEAYGTEVSRTTNFTWDSNAQLNRLLSVTVPGESKVSYTYNAQNRLASVTRTNLTGIGTANQSLTTTYAYSLYGDGMVHTLVATAPSPGGSDKTTSTYDSHGNLISVADGLGHTTTYANYNGLGEVGKVVGPNGAETDYTYDARGRVATKTTHPNGGTATWTYAYDGFGLLAKVSAPDGEVTTWNRDAEKRVKTITHNDKDGTSTETFAYDAKGDVTSDVIKRGSDIGKATSYAYDALGRVYQVKGSHGQVQTYTYDGNGNVLSVTDALGHKTSYAYDALNRVVGVTNAAGGVTSYAYDAGDHVVQVTDPRGLVTSYSYDGLGNLWKQVSPDTGTTWFTWDGYGRLASKRLSGATLQSFSYDVLNRLTGAKADAFTRAWTYDSCTHGLGRLCSTSGDDNEVDFSYTPEGWIAARGFSFTNGPVYVLAYAYDNMGHLTQVAYPDGNQAIYYYTDGVVSQVNLQVGTYLVVGVNGISYRPMDLAMSGWTSYNGLTNRIDYDSDLRPTSIAVPGVESLAFSYDADNRITHITNGLDSSMTQSLGYDALNRLVSVSSGADNKSYSYDADGNRLNAMINGVGWTYTPSGTSNRLQSVSHGGQVTHFTYNPEGDVLGYGPGASPQMFYYTGFDRLNGTYINGLSTHYHVSAEGQRLYKVTTDTATYFAPDTSGKLLAEDQNGDWMDYVWLNGRVVTVISNGGVFPIASDQTGRPLALTHPATRDILWQAQALPFDRNVAINHWGNFNVGFPGQYYDQEDGLWYNGHRDYDAQLGRYIESDPIGLAGGVNTYAYVGNNPISNVDPLGLCDKKPNCNTVLPNGQTIGQVVQNSVATIQIAASFDPSGVSKLGAFLATVQSRGPIDFKNNMGPDPTGFLGAAGNFAYGAIASGIGYSQSLAELGAGAYAAHAGKLNLNNPYGEDNSAAQNLPAGYATLGCTTQ